MLHCPAMPSMNAIAAVPVVGVLSVDETVDKVVAYSLAENISNPVEILRCLQKDLVTGQPLEQGSTPGYLHY